MKVNISTVDQVIVIDGEGLKISDWPEIKIPSSIKAVNMDSDVNIGFIEWIDSDIPNMPINSDQFNTMFAACLGVYERVKAEKIIKAQEIKSKLADEQAATLVEAQKKEFERIDIENRIVIIEKKLNTIQEEKEPL